MKIKTTAIATTLLLAASVSSSVNAQESAVHQILSSMISQALDSAATEIDHQVDKSIISAGHMLSLDSSEPKGKVTITDIVAVKNDSNVEQSKRSSDE